MRSSRQISGAILGVAMLLSGIAVAQTLNIRSFKASSAERGDWFFIGQLSDQQSREVNFRPTGSSFEAFPIGTPGTLPVYRFYGCAANPGEIGSPNSHFFTINEGEKEALRALRSGGATGPGWCLEGAVFSAAVPVNGTCPAFAPAKVERLYNEGQRKRIDSNHFYAVTPGQAYDLQATGWGTLEGTAFCVKSAESAMQGRLFVHTGATPIPGGAGTTDNTIFTAFTLPDAAAKAVAITTSPTLGLSNCRASAASERFGNVYCATQNAKRTTTSTAQNLFAISTSKATLGRLYETAQERMFGVAVDDASGTLWATREVPPEDGVPPSSTIRAWREQTGGFLRDTQLPVPTGAPKALGTTLYFEASTRQLFAMVLGSRGSLTFSNRPDDPNKPSVLAIYDASETGELVQRAALPVFEQFTNLLVTRRYLIIGNYNRTVEIIDRASLQRVGTFAVSGFQDSGGAYALAYNEFAQTLFVGDGAAQDFSLTPYALLSIDISTPSAPVVREKQILPYAVSSLQFFEREQRLFVAQNPDCCNRSAQPSVIEFTQEASALRIAAKYNLPVGRFPTAMTLAR
jgi:hypothetical protein